MDANAQRAWVARWRRATAALADQRARELAEVTDEAALAAADSVLALAALVPIAPERLAWSGLVRQQELLERLRSS